MPMLKRVNEKYHQDPENTIQLRLELWIGKVWIMNWKTFGNILLLLVAMCFSSLSNADTVWIDVRSVAEHSIDNIEGDVRIYHGDIVQEVIQMFPNKSTEIHLSCR